MQFEWDPKKALGKKAKHDVSLEDTGGAPFLSHRASSAPVPAAYLGRQAS